MKVSELPRRVIIVILIVALVALAASVIYYRSTEFLPFMYGLLIGTATSVLKVLLLERAVNKTLSMDKKKVGGYVSLQHLLRLGISGAALAIGALVDGSNLWGVVAGVLAYQLAWYIARAKTSASGVADLVHVESSVSGAPVAEPHTREE